MEQVRNPASGSRTSPNRHCTAWPFFIVFLFLLTSSHCVRAGSDFLQSSWGEKEIKPVLDRTLRLHLDPPLESLTQGEKKAVGLLLEAGQIFQDIYLLSEHPEALSAFDTLQQLHNSRVNPARTGALLDVYRVMQGPIATTLDNARVPFLPVVDEEPGKNVYPQGTTKETLDVFFTAHPERRDDLLDLRSVVLEATPANAQRTLEALDKYPALDVLHPGLRSRLEAVLKNPTQWVYYAEPYSVAYADQICRAYDLINGAADAVDADDPVFAHYLRLRARDLLADDYEGSDAAWVTSTFKGNLNAQIGSYETYDDALHGVKSFFGMSVLLRDRKRSEEIASAMAGIQRIEDMLPYEPHKRVRDRIPVGVYNIIADFGQTRGTNTATILPNESHLARQYGRTILLRANILTNPEIFASAQEAFNAATIRKHHDELKPDGDLNRTLWHEVGHYLGVDRTADGRELDAALQDIADLLEELKADLVSLVAAPLLTEQGIYNETDLRAIYASGIRRTLQKNRPRRDQPYGTMNLIQFNWFLKNGLLEFHQKTGLLEIHYDRYDETVVSLLREILALQLQGSRDAANAFVEKWTSWESDLHEVVAANMRATEKYRYSLVTYEALREKPGE